jgi:spore germination protein GerM
MATNPYKKRFESTSNVYRRADKKAYFADEKRRLTGKDTIQTSGAIERARKNVAKRNAVDLAEMQYNIDPVSVQKNPERYKKDRGLFIKKKIALQKQRRGL